MNKKGFTLAELIAVIVIVGLILLTAVPAVYKLLSNNKNQKYEYYYKMVEEAAYAYANTMKDDLGNSLSSGCINITVDKLVSYNFLKRYNINNETVSDSQVIINNNKGTITVDIYLKIGNYTMGEKKNDVDSTCVNNVVSKKNNLYDVFKNINAIASDGYVTIQKNYVWYSGKLWRAIWADSKKEYVKLVSSEIISTVPFMQSQNNFKYSYVESWLNEYFLSSLYNPNKYLVTYNWEYRKGMYSAKKVGLTSKKDLEKESYLTGTFWTLTPTDDNKLYCSATASCANNTINGIRPAIYIKSTVNVIDGTDYTGSKERPYQLEGNETKERSNELLNTRYSGEYVKGKNNKYRIVSVNSEVVKLISVEERPLKALQGVDYTLSSEIYNDIDSCAKDDFSNLLIPGDWYFGEKNDYHTRNYVLGGGINSNIRSLKIGLPMYTELFANNESNTYCLWTLTRENNTDTKMITLKNNKTSSLVTNDTNKCKYKYMVYIEGNTKILSGNGTLNNPFTIFEEEASNE